VYLHPLSAGPLDLEGAKRSLIENIFWPGNRENSKARILLKKLQRKFGKKGEEVVYLPSCFSWKAAKFCIGMHPKILTNLFLVDKGKELYICSRFENEANVLKNITEKGNPGWAGT